MERVIHAMIEGAEALELVLKPGHSARFGLTFDEYRLDLNLTYEGEAFVTRGPAPSPEELIGEPKKQLTRLAVMMIRRLATKMSASSSGRPST